MPCTMTLEEILALSTCDYPTTTVAEAIEYKDVSDVYYKLLREQMRQDGYNRVPLWVPDNATLANGHHRVKLALELGWHEMRVTDDYLSACPHSRVIVRH